MERIFGLFVILFISNLILVVQLNAQSTKVFKTSKDTLVVYSDVPGLTPSNKYTMRVRSAATNNEWVQCLFKFYLQQGFTRINN